MNRTIAAIGIVAALAAVYVFLIAPLDEKRVDIQERLRMDYATLHKYEAVSGNREQIEPLLEQTRNDLQDIEQNIFPKTDLSVAFAKLQKNVQALARESGLTVTSVKPLPTISYEHYTGLPLYIDCAGDIKELSEFLKSLDSRDVFYRIDRLNIAASRNGSLRIKMQLSGLMRSA